MVIMKKFQIVTLLLAGFVFSVVAVASASAETTLLAQWLFNGAAITALLSVETTGTFFFKTLVLGINAAEVECAGAFDGSVGPNGEDEITALLNIAKEEISKTELVGTFLDCTAKTASTEECLNGELVEAWPGNLPWHTNLELKENGSILKRFLNGLIFEFNCTITKKENRCTGSTSTTMTNGATDVIGKFDETSAHATCTTGEGDLLGEGLTFGLEAGTLAVSSE